MKPLLVAVLLVLVAGCGSGGDDKPAAKKPESSFQVRGTFTIADDSGVSIEGGTCEGTSGYDDLAGGAQVTVRDADNKTVALGTLKVGHPVTGSSCVFEFQIDDVPDSGDLYSVEVSHRGQVSFKKADAGSLDLSVG